MLAHGTTDWNEATKDFIEDVKFPKGEESVTIEGEESKQYIWTQNDEKNKIMVNGNIITEFTKIDFQHFIKHFDDVKADDLNTFKAYQDGFNFKSSLPKVPSHLLTIKQIKYIAENQGDPSPVASATVAELLAKANALLLRFNAHPGVSKNAQQVFNRAKEQLSEAIKEEKKEMERVRKIIEETEEQQQQQEKKKDKQKKEKQH